MFNKVILAGNLARDIEIRYLTSGTAIAKSAIETQSGEEVCFLDFTIFGRTAEFANHLKKGSKVLLEGRLQWTDQDGSNRCKCSLRAENIIVLDTKQDSNTQALIIDALTEENRALREALAKEIVEKRLIEEQASKCHLTRAYTRQAYELEVEKYFNENKDTLAFAFIDADNFKKINDTYGHHAGDEVLKHMVDTMFKATRDNDGKVYRYGGEEFVLLFPNIQKEQFEAQLEKLRSQIEKSFLSIDGRKIRYTISIGGAFANDYKDAKELARKADEAVYKAKDLGRNRIVLA